MTSLKKALITEIPKALHSYIPSAFDIVGDIAIFNEIPKQIKKYEKKIAKKLLEIQPRIKAILKKTGKYSGKYRLAKLKRLAGERRKETIHKENGVLMKVHVEKCYFSTRTSTERLRLASKIKKNESVLVMFSGVAPFCLVIAKRSKAREVYGIEINKKAHKYAIENVKLNNLKNIHLIHGDVNKILPPLRKKFDRVIMPLPRDADSFLDLALDVVEKKGIIHLYQFAEKKQIPEIKKLYKQKFSKVNVHLCSQYAPRVYKICLELQ
jgi:tRNA (guanine37-N1)-methyltransferase